MKHKLTKINEECQQICTQTKAQLNDSQESLKKLNERGHFKGFNNLDEFDAWFYSGKPLTL